MSKTTGRLYVIAGLALIVLAFIFVPKQNEEIKQAEQLLERSQRVQRTSNKPEDGGKKEEKPVKVSLEFKAGFAE